MSWYLKVLKNYVGFEGRARRKEYWMFVLFNFIISFVLGFIQGFTKAFVDIGNILTILYNLAVFIPALAVTFRRLHDTGRSGWWVLISLIPIAGGIVMLVFTCLDSDEGNNKYGPNPKYYS
ncbi:uncharacterized membrane protein YhaH (DUF805 family) [Fontibacillus solani]|uniref:Uncharacterized membrane protein YhaH (DUF805 family) n=1 Tax=Fontibacillus solani TaxID=1572857 RepID=A0A7W3SPV5_9BACL|nr:DUF805 domain-containing protein [Fontibacillus solani]MBA9083889.1 uncharacterized membrane protein YhaH (DUF805 family) [Fontibacillus solani]